VTLGKLHYLLILIKLVNGGHNPLYSVLLQEQ